MSSKENKRQAQKRRAEERERARQRVVRNRILIGLVAVCFVGFLIFMTVRNPGSSIDEDALKSDTMTTDADTTTDAAIDAIEEAAGAAQEDADEEGDASLDTTEGREVKEGDTVAIDYVGTKDGVAFDGGTGSYDLTIGSGAFIDGFEDGLIGKKVGETVDLDLTFPENYGAEELAGQDVVFTVTINGIYDE